MGAVRIDIFEIEYLGWYEMSLEDGYLIAGIVVAIVAVVTLFLQFRDKSPSTTNQNAKISGQHNSITQNSNISTGGKTEDQ